MDGRKTVSMAEDRAGKNTKEAKGSVVSVRMSREEELRIRELASDREMSVSEWCRQVLMIEADVLWEEEQKHEELLAQQHGDRVSLRKR